MKTLAVFVTGLSISLLGFFSREKNYVHRTEEGINFFEGSFKEALSLAKKENKIIFLDIYASWCGPCKRLKSKTFKDESVVKFYNSNFINISLDGEVGEGEQLANVYGVRAYPTLLFLDSSGKIIYKTEGFHNPTEFIELGQYVLNLKK
ncbi:MAG: hypothetical protein OHK0036_04380 [Bacteroidia bacterium]